MHSSSPLQTAAKSYQLNTPESNRRLGTITPKLSRQIAATGFTWSEIRTELAKRGFRAAGSDPLLRPILTEFKCQPDELWHDILLYLFLPSLERLARILRYLDDNPVALDSQIGWAFVQVLHRVDLQARRMRLGQKILNDVQHDVRRFYRAERELVSRNVPIVCWDDDEDEKASIAVNEPAADDPEMHRAEVTHDNRWSRNLLKQFVATGQLSKPAYMILIGHLLYDRPLRVMAQQLGISHEAAKKRYQRATEFLEKNAGRMSPAGPSHPLWEAGGVTRKERP